MPRLNARSVAIAGIAVIAAVWAWRVLLPSDEARIHDRLDEVVALVNRRADGVDAMARAAQIGRAFTADVVVELRQGAPIRGKATLMAMAARLQPRTGGVNLEIRDVTIAVLDPSRARTELTATWSDPSGADPSLEATELRLEMVKQEGDWLIARVEPVEVLRR